MRHDHPCSALSSEQLSVDPINMLNDRDQTALREIRLCDARADQ
jgi:hypothetical protein